jgi:exopolyphosphatase/guanosine-5'-triphosphate,3'-diphosphate pyrophosphatase
MDERDIVSDAKYGADAIINYLEEIETRIEGALEGEDPEYIHKIRTNSRRLRTALSIFHDIFKGTDIGTGDIKTMMKDLGKARDLDVRVIKIDSWLSTITDPELKNTLVELKKIYLEKRKREQKRVEISLKEASKKGFLKETGAISRDVLSRKGDHEPYSSSLYKRAFEEIGNRIEEVKRLSVKVEDEAAFEDHHRLRISAKHLRYSLSLFSKIYAGGIDEEREELVKLQDAAGEMHDFDVWIGEMNKILGKIQRGKEIKFKAGEEGLHTFLEFMKKRRQKEYNGFVEAWKRISEERILESILQTCSSTLELNSGVKTIGLISDVHGNRHALDAVLADAGRRGVTHFLNAGDTVGYGAFSKESLEICTGQYFYSVKGNIDRDVAIREGEEGLKGFALDYARRSLSEGMRERLDNLPETRKVKINGLDLLLVHGSPDSMDEHLRSNSPFERFENISIEHPYDIIVFGHTHEQFTRKTGNTLFLNPGSVGRNSEGTTKAQYALVRTDPFSFEMVNLDYDVRNAVLSMRENDLPEEFSQMILRGIGLKEVRKLEFERPGIEWIKEFSKKYYWNLDHPSQVMKLSILLFDELKNLHGMGDDERWMLECGSLLHDIGWSLPEVPHHKASLELILNDTELPFSNNDRYMVGSIARYHRKSLPTLDHYNYRRLDEDDRKTIEKLASLVRIADGLDCSHGSIVRTLSVSIGEEKVTIECKVTEGPFWEDEKVKDKKKDFFEETFGMEVLLEWERI